MSCQQHSSSTRRTRVNCLYLLANHYNINNYRTDTRYKTFRLQRGIRCQVRKKFGENRSILHFARCRGVPFKLIYSLLEKPRE